MTVSTYIHECGECGGVMKSTWSDGKTRVHQMECVRCENRMDKHESDLRYIEARHFDPWTAIGTDRDYEQFVDTYESHQRHAVDEAFTPDIAWATVQIRHNSDGTYSVSAHDDRAEKGEGVGRDEDLPYGHPDVSWSAETVYLGDIKFEMVDLNKGSAWVFLNHVTDISIERDESRGGDLIRIEV